MGTGARGYGGSTPLPTYLPTKPTQSVGGWWLGVGDESGGWRVELSNGWVARGIGGGGVMRYNEMK